MVKVKEKQWEFTVKPLLHGISDLEVFVWLRPKTAYVLPYTSSIFANLTYDTRDLKDVWLQGIPLQMRALPNELTKDYNIIIEAYLGYYWDGINNKGLIEYRGSSVRLIEPYRRRVREALYKTLNAVAKEI